MKLKSTMTVLLLSFILVFSFIGCENADNEAPADTTENVSNTTNDAENTDTSSSNEDTTSEDTSEPIESDLPARNDIPEVYRWDLEKVFSDTNDFMKDVEAVRDTLSFFEAKESTFTSDYKTFKDVLETYEKARRMTDKIYVFATLQAHTDTTNTDFSDLEDIAAQLDTELTEATSYFLPIIANMDENTLNEYMANEEMAGFKPYIDSIMKNKEHILTVKEEALLASAQILFEVPESIYDAYNYNTDLSPYLPEPEFAKFWTGTREDRLQILSDYYLKTQIGNDLLAEIYESEIKKNTFFAQARNFDTALDSTLSTDGITRNEYNKVFEVTHNNLDVLHKWVSMKKEILGIEDKLHFYDQYSPLIADPYAYADYESGKEIIYAALAPLGEKYIADLKKGFESRWVDVYTTNGKYEGGYQWGTYDTDPFVLINYNNFMTDVSTAAHEMGHAINFKYSNEAQGYFSSNVPIFNAEIASTTNEALVFEYRIANAKTPLEKQQALLSYIELIENTIFTQMIYADFEKRAYEAYDAGEPINADLFNGIMGDVLKEYYGPDYELDEVTTYQWSEIPHFYNSYYVYKYATGLSAGLNFADNILNGSPKDLENYLNYLAAGSSEEPLVLLERAGVDFSTGEPLQKAFDRFEALIDEFYETVK